MVKSDQNTLFPLLGMVKSDRNTLFSLLEWSNWTGIHVFALRDDKTELEYTFLHGRMANLAGIHVFASRNGKTELEYTILHGRMANLAGIHISHSDNSKHTYFANLNDGTIGPESPT